MNLSTTYKKIYQLFSLSILAFSFSNVSAQGNLLVTPKRIVFEGTKRSEELNLANTGKDTATYAISLIQLRMKKDGSVEEITEPDSLQQFADKYLRFFPKRITLAPNEAQTVKLQLIKTNELQPGEYRSHLYFRAVPNDKPLGEKDTESSSGISVKLVPIFGISLPVIIRSGETNAQVDISDASVDLQTAEPVLKVTFNRSGNMSVYGDILADYISPSGKTTNIGKVKGVAVYTPNTSRNFLLQLNKNPGVDYHKGKIRLVFVDQSPKPVKLAEKEIALM